MMKSKISKDLVAAMKSKDKEKLQVLRSIKTDIKNREIEAGKELNDQDVENILMKAVKSREQALEMYVQGGRDDLVKQEKLEIEIIKAYLPQPLSVDELSELVDKAVSELEATAMKDMGRVMKYLKEAVGNRADGSTLSTLVKKKLTT